MFSLDRGKSNLQKTYHASKDDLHTASHDVITDRDIGLAKNG